MASMIFNSFWNDLFKGNIDLDTDTYKLMLVVAAGVAAANKDTWAKRSDVTNEVAAGGGYTAGGQTVTVTVAAVDTANDRQEATLGGYTWASSTISAAGGIYYKSRGGAASADELVAMNDFGGTISSTSGNFAVAASTLRVQN